MAVVELDEDIKTRFCPSPTGQMHIGNLRTALFNALLAKHAGGTFLLRIEDSDRVRSNERYTELLQQDLKWLGLNWQEGPGCDDGLGPYHQSKRQAIYNDYYKRLLAMGAAYPCFCSEEQLALSRKIQRSAGKPPRYSGTCRGLSEDQIKEKEAAGIQPTLRFRIPNNQVIEFEDLVRGVQRFQSDDIGDFIIRRHDGTPPFMYCNAIDDALMEVTHALRGEDHLTNTPRQIMILDTLGLPIPTYGHIALIVGADGSPLSKRHGSRSVNELREQGYLPAAIINYLARLGHYYGHDDLLTFDELAEQFKIESLSKSPAKYNPEQLNYWQKQALTQLSSDQLYQWLENAIKDQVPEQYRDDFVDLVKPNIYFPEDAKRWAGIIFNSEFKLNETMLALIEKTDHHYFSESLNALDRHGTDVKLITDHLKKQLDIKGKALYMPLRVAITGETHGPELDKILKIMNANEVKRRLEMLAHG